jgi:hypothetical protein
MILGALVLLTAELPDPGRLATILLASALGGFAGGAIGRARRSRELTAKLTGDGIFTGFAVGPILWLAAVAIDRL